MATIVASINENLGTSYKADSYVFDYVRLKSSRQIIKFYHDVGQRRDDAELLRHLALNARILVCLHLLHAFDIEEMNYQNVKVEEDQIFEELLFYPAIYFYRQPEGEPYRQRCAELLGAGARLYSLDYFHFRCLTLQYTDFDEFRAEMGAFLASCCTMNRGHRYYGRLSEQLSARFQRVARAVAAVAFPDEQPELLEPQAAVAAPVFATGHYGGRFTEFFAYPVLRESRVRRKRGPRPRREPGAAGAKRLRE